MTKKTKTYQQTQTERAKAAGGAMVKPCPFCGGTPVITPWHGGKLTKVMIMCYSDDCHVGPQMCGETMPTAVRRWNDRTAASTPVHVQCTPDF